MLFKIWRCGMEILCEVIEEDEKDPCSNNYSEILNPFCKMCKYQDSSSQVSVKNSNLKKEGKFGKKATKWDICIFSVYGGTP